MDKHQLFNSIAKNYDSINNAISLFTHRSFRKKALANIDSSPLKILDLCCGTGDMSHLLHLMFPQAEITGIDFSENMLEIAKNRLPDIDFILGDISSLPFEDEVFDLCVVSFGLRNVNDLEKVLKECARVLKPDGRFFNLDLGKPNKFWNIFLKPYMYICVPMLGKLTNGNSIPLKYFVHSNETFPSPLELVRIYKKYNLLQIKRQDFLFGQISSQVCKKITNHL